MAHSKPTFLTHLKNLLRHHHHRTLAPVFLRFLSFATPEEAAAERRRRKRRLRIEPPLSSLRNQQLQAPQQPRQPPQNPNAPKIPEPISSLSGNRLNLHNKILTLIRQNDLEEASLFTRHSIYSNCRPTIYTVNAVLTALIRQSRYSDFLALHRFIIQAGVAPNIITHNLLINVYCDCRKYDTAIEHYKQLINDAPFNPSSTTYRILIKGLIDGNRLEKCLELKEQMLGKGFDADPIVYNHLMVGYLRNEDADGAFKVYEELKEKMGVDVVEDGVVYGSLMKAYFMKAMEKEAMEFYQLAVREDSKVKMSAMAFNYVLDALCKNGKSEETLSLFDRIMEEHSPPKRLTINIGSFNVMVEWYCSLGKFEDAMAVFRKMGEKRCSPDALSFNVLIAQLCNNALLAEAEGLYGEMGAKGVNPDESTFVLLMDACFKADRADDAVRYYRKMLDSGLRPNLAVYNKVVDGLVKVGNIDEAKSIFDIMVKKLKMDAESYKFIMKALSDSGRLDEVLEIAYGMLDEEVSPLDEEMQEFVRGELGKVGREEDLTKLMEEKVRQKEEAKAKEAEAAEKAKASARAAVSALMPSKLFGTKETKESTENVVETSIVNEKEQADSEKSGSAEASPDYEQSGSVNGTISGEIVVPIEQVSS